VLSENFFIGKHIDHYRLLAKISSNPTSSVYRAEYTLHTDSNIIIKLFHTGRLSEQKRTLFFQEVQLLKKIRHAHILPILDEGIFEDTPYLVTEYAAQGSLRERIHTLQSGRLLPTQKTLAILVQIGQALQYAHQLNISHGNLKPENILFREENNVLLADFSVITLFDTMSSDRTQYASIYPYLAPERFQGRMYKESDQYALGCIAYELLAGQVPFTAASFAEIQHKHTTEKPAALTQRNLLLPISLDETILKAMEKKSEDRYPGIKDFVARLSTFTEGPSHKVKLSQRAASMTSTPKLLSNIATIVSISKNAEPVLEIEKVASESSDDQLAQAFPAFLQPSEQETQETEMTGKIAARLSPATRHYFGRNSNSRNGLQRSNQSFRQMGLIFVVLWVVIVAIIYSSFSFGLSSRVSPKSTPNAISQKALTTPTVRPAQTPTSRPKPTVTSAPAPKQAQVVTPSPTPFPSPTPTPMLIVTPTSFEITNDCFKQFSHYMCVVTLQLPSNYMGNLKWTASGSGGTIYFNPTRGILSPGQQQEVNAFVPVTCPRSGLLDFTTKDGTITIPWSC